MEDLIITEKLFIPKEEVEIKAVHSQGAGGQHVNKVASGIHLRFDIQHSSLPEEVRQRLLQRPDRRINKDGILIIKSQQSRSQETNRRKACETLVSLVQEALIERRKRKKTKPSRSSVSKRIDRKKLRGKVKELRQKITS